MIDTLGNRLMSSMANQQHEEVASVLMTLEGAVDLHVHSRPDLFERIWDDTDVALQAREAGMRAIVLKSHFESTVGRAQHTMQQVSGIQVLGGVVLNKHVGGINPSAVEACLMAGGRIIWMPTVDAEHHSKFYGSIGTYSQDGKPTGPSMGQPRRYALASEGLSLLADGELTGAAKETIKLVSEHNAILATSHISAEETFEIARFARNNCPCNVLITHPFTRFVKLDLDSLSELVQLGVWVEFCAVVAFPPICDARIEDVVRAVGSLGADHCIISSDGGAPIYPSPYEAMRSYIQCLYELGVTAEQIDQMIRKNPTQLLFAKESRHAGR
jgi:hypothetical protein